eukprot:GHVU01168458.1.p3 GENE.GHVU01168458.1~~GHVU01168458.1.p3  ORF type:complete len:102 (-),score=4.46 GHVU01168458.1:6-311(-)
MIPTGGKKEKVPDERQKANHFRCYHTFRSFSVLLQNGFGFGGAGTCVNFVLAASPVCRLPYSGGAVPDRRCRFHHPAYSTLPSSFLSTPRPWHRPFSHCPA